MVLIMALLILSNMLLWYALVDLSGIIRDLAEKEKKNDEQP